MKNRLIGGSDGPPPPTVAYFVDIGDKRLEWSGQLAFNPRAVSFWDRSLDDDDSEGEEWKTASE